MIIKFIFLGGYGFYIWPAFIITFASLFLFYIKTNKELIKYKKLYVEKFGEDKEESTTVPEQEKVFSNS